MKFKALDYLVNFSGDGPYRSKEEQNRFLKIQSQYYKNYESFNVVEKIAPIQKLEPLKLSGKKLQLIELAPPKTSKEKALLTALAKYKFLTTEQMIILKLSKHLSGLPTAKLEKSGFLKSVRVQIEKLQKNVKMYFLTKKGSKFMRSELAEGCQVNYPTSGITKISQVDHKIGVINHAIQFSRFELGFIFKDIDNSGIRNQKVTALIEGERKLEPDMLFSIKTPSSIEYYTFEYERLKDSKKSFQKVVDSFEFMQANTFQKQYKFKKEYRSLFVFEEESTMKSVMSKCLKHEIPLELFLFKRSDDPITHWINYKCESREIAYV